MSKNAIRKYCSAFASKRKEKLRMETWNHLVGQKCFFYLISQSCTYLCRKALNQCTKHNAQWGCAWMLYLSHKVAPGGDEKHAYAGILKHGISGIDGISQVFSGIKENTASNCNEQRACAAIH